MRRFGSLLSTGLLAAGGCATAVGGPPDARLGLRGAPPVAQDEEEDAFYRPPEKPRRPVAPGPGPELTGEKAEAGVEKPGESRLAAGGLYLRTDEMEGFYLGAEYEFGLGKGFTLALRGDGFAWDWDNRVDLEIGERREEREGWGTGLGMELRLYVLGVALDGLSFGFGATLAPLADTTARSDRDKGGDFGPGETDHGRGPILETHLSVGYSFEVTGGLFVTPAAMAGVFDPGDEGVNYAGAGVWVSYRF